MVVRTAGHVECRDSGFVAQEGDVFYVVSNGSSQVMTSSRPVDRTHDYHTGMCMARPV